MKNLIASILILFSTVVMAGDNSNDEIKGGGTIYFIFDLASETTVNGILFARFIPDTQSLKNFPAVISGKHPGEVKYISLEPADEALEATLGKNEAYRVSHGAMPRVIEVPVQIVLTNYQTDIECDSRVYYAKLVRVKAVGKHAANIGNGPNGC